MLLDQYLAPQAKKNLGLKYVGQISFWNIFIWNSTSSLMKVNGINSSKYCILHIIALETILCHEWLTGKDQSHSAEEEL